jgi:hypothetical protein
MHRSPDLAFHPCRYHDACENLSNKHIVIRPWKVDIPQEAFIAALKVDV